ncbi:hypothetical protein [uncultured Halovibrio sp.]|uniref:hypothetical protein n=1 Tax=uncultured Halovibrio sp. TaxID=985049 RepID=UPI0025F4788D|nr:hypothetical protein [uncultured Halovibrio sp.]
MISTLQGLEKAPILTKKDFIQSGSTPRQKARFHRHTAGSSGTPTDVWLNRNELGRMLGVRDYCYRHCGIRVGDREGRIWGRPERGLKSIIKQFLLNRQVFHPSGRFLKEEVERLIQWRPTYLYGYASLLLECAQEVERSERSIPGLKCVIVTAETIIPSQKAFLGRAFNCSVHEEYGASEFDIIAFECGDGHRHLVNPWLIIESGPEAQALVTDVSRKTQSLIRYELGDVLQMNSTECHSLGDHQVISVLEGRLSNQFAVTAQSEKFHAVEFGHIIERYQSDFGDVFQFTFIQDVPGRFRLECSPIPEQGIEVVARYVEDMILRKTGYSIQVITNKEPNRSEKKKTYFVAGDT